MERRLTQQLLEWKNRPGHLPLILRGARQVGKTFLVEQFGNKHFQNLVTVNCETDIELLHFFGSLDPTLIIQGIGFLKQQPIIPGQTLLFLDEIQNCPKALLALRYFKEKLPELHVIAAGSLLEFTLNDHALSIPVGRVEFLYLKPLSFIEFLQALGFTALTEHLESISLKTPLQQTLHEELLRLVQQYFIVGGMPAVAAEFASTQSWINCQRIQGNLLQTYQYDFGKYSSTSQHKYLQQLFGRLPFLICQNFKYSKVDPDFKSREIKVALQLLQDAGLISPIYATAASGLPLRATINEKKFKLLFVDLGLVQHSLGLEDILLGNRIVLNQVNAGQLAEQFVGQELLAYHEPSINFHLHYWERTKKNSEAEVDYIIQADDTIIPLEVKAGATGRLKSLQIFMKEKSSPLGIKISQEPLHLKGEILTIPFYLISQLPRIIQILR